MSLLVATTNPGKAKEFAELLRGLPLLIATSVLTLRDVPPVADVAETGDTFTANAALKAIAYATATGHWTLADDSGLEVDALAGKPGVYSARWAALHEAGTGDAANNHLLLRQMSDVPAGQRGARFVCVLALSSPAGRVVLTSRGVMEGSICFDPAGDNGFGYDPLFRVAALDRTSAQLSPEHKHAISHRGNALRRLAATWNRSGLVLAAK